MSTVLLKRVALTDVKLQLFFSNNTYVLYALSAGVLPAWTATIPAMSTHVPLAFSWQQDPETLDNPDNVDYIPLRLTSLFTVSFSCIRTLRTTEWLLELYTENSCSIAD